MNEKDGNTKEKKSGISRRSFLGRVSTTAVGSYLFASGLKGTQAETLTDKEKDEAIHQGKVPVTLTINNISYALLVTPETTLVEVIRDHVGLTGTKIVCGNGECGACTVLVDDVAVYSCHYLALDADGKSITTVEGLMDGEKPHPIQEAFVIKDGMQCGFCTPGQVMAAAALLKANPKPTREEIMVGMSGNLCRCAAYPNIIDSVEEASKKL